MKFLLSSTKTPKPFERVKLYVVPQSDSKLNSNTLNLRPSNLLLLVAMPFVPSSFLFLVVRPGAPSRFLFLFKALCLGHHRTCQKGRQGPWLADRRAAIPSLEHWGNIGQGLSPRERSAHMVKWAKTSSAPHGNHHLPNIGLHGRLKVDLRKIRVIYELFSNKKLLDS